ncbi:nucleotidyltransferase domain-containing protein [Peribacillus sp. SCS-26]|uniref:nucleotidyltransferase domain-containing protein n=1 Tax=Paraperibacillus marinus TaxID=3115295 RepID=UPI003905C2A6
MGNAENWEPLSVNDAAQIFNNIPIAWWIAGGWALDLFLGRQTREHADLDVVILRHDYLSLYRYLHDKWEMSKAAGGRLIRWEKDETLNLHDDNIWIKKKGSPTWAFQVMILNTENEEWIYKRKKTIRKAVKDIWTVSSIGIPILRPEVQLLYKGGSSVLREKDLMLI